VDLVRSQPAEHAQTRRHRQNDRLPARHKRPPRPRLRAKQPTPTTTTPLPQAGNCEAWVGVAYGIGWPIATLDTLKLAMQLESGCDPAAVGDNGASIGLLQIHQPSWCRPNAYWPQGWMQHYGIGDCKDLYDPIINLRVGLMLYEGWDRRITRLAALARTAMKRLAIIIIVLYVIAMWRSWS